MNIIEKWGQSLGGAEALNAIENYHLVYELEAANLKGTLQVWQMADGRRRIEIKLGEVFTHTNVFDGSASFSSENGGQYREDAGTDLAIVASYAYVESFSAFLPDRMQAHAPPVIDDAGGVISCTLTPTAGFAMQYFLSKEHLPDSLVIASDGQRMVTQYSQWKMAKDVVWPHVQLLTSGDARFDEKYTLQSVETNLELNDSLFVRPNRQASRARFPDASDSSVVAMKLFGNHIFIPVKVNGKDSTLWFIFDTGAAVSVLNKDRLTHLGIETAGAARGHGIGEGSVEVSFATGVSLDIAGVAVDDLNIAAISLDKLAPRLGRSFDGIIGGDILSELTARINYRDSTLTLYAKGAFRPPQEAKELKVRFEGNIPYVEASLKTHNGLQAHCRLYLDTGKRAGISIYHHFAEENGIIGKDIPFVEAPSGFGVGGQATAQFVRVPEFSFGGATVTKALVAVELGSESRDSVNYDQGSIGGDFLRFFTLTFDYSEETVWVEQAYDAVGHGEMDMLGVTINESESDSGVRGFEIASVLPNSPAENFGLEPGDIITAIDGVAVTELTLPAARSLFKSRDGRRLVLSFTRNDQPHKATVTLKRMI